MKWIVVPVVLTGVLALGSPARSQTMSGCWNYSDGTVFSSVCFDSASRGSFNLEYAIEDPAQGLVKGSCIADIEIREMTESRVVFTVPYQENACRQEDQVFRIAQRDYSCARDGARLTCDLVVFYDDGSVFSEATGLEYAR